MAERNRVYGVTELAAEFGLTPQALRYYEEKGLLAPQRAGGRRVFTYRDRARLMLILKFRRVGFSLEQIAEYLAHYRSGRPSAGQYHDGLRKIRARLIELERMQSEIAEVILELKAMEADAERRLAACKPDEDLKPNGPEPEATEPGVKRCCAE
ncbi:DNA-binding transcriptional MerR regulator [Azospirillum lipoferum]|uniref:MerR family DNA-binding transcriptional regulator n=1 Tax=Azospirillum lipoferum TaxID=193 RepID=A0A5A9GE21_AZOLI|nr:MULTISPECIES: MerR family DNA-binding transcriptional regulator [Azospirillum]KAA0591954.1 MerR family DNA-binding transcriptional regulator [Azospirillum lipoferum]MCP1614722.1 DNA-binding transcriptional MerR regulator [Azospirillum lipoferum]MDW5537442.1 MerR family DNA-binding transcriptional regulator [Azospirillum sp. NL1]